MVGQGYPITGTHSARGKHGEVPVKMEVDDWWLSQDPIHVNQRSLVMTALNKMYDMDPADKLGYFQIGGSHIVLVSM
jgi:tyrosinase